jgi:hypothetical protein
MARGLRTRITCADHADNKTCSRRPDLATILPRSSAHASPRTQSAALLNCHTSRAPGAATIKATLAPAVPER